MKKITLLATLLTFTLNAAPPTTVILVRHAEKAGEPEKDPPLTAEGQERATELARVLRGAGITAIFTTNFKRTQATAKPIAAALTIVPAVNTPGPTYAKDIANLIRKKHAGKTVLVVGHSNTTSDVIAALGVANPPAIPDDEFDNVYIVTLADGAEPRLVSLKYGR